MKPELRKVFDSAESRTDGLAPHEVAFIIKNAGDKRESALSVINQAKASTPEGRDALRAVFDGERSNIGGELRAQVDRISANREVRNLEKSLREKTGSYRFDSARGLLAQRAELVNEMRDLAGDASLSIPERQQRFHNIESQIHALVQDAREEMVDGDREVEVRSLTHNNPLFAPRRPASEASEWRS